jgi:peptidyl-tRNA hydrolase, PTH1 family
MKAVVGLGNPGTEYARTRHNVGFEVVDELARRWTVVLKKWKSVANTAVVRDHDVVLARPRTYMNESGQAIQAIMAFYRIQPADLLVVVDEAQLPLGKLRLRATGSAGGHNGLKSVVEHIGDGFPRLRIGVDRGDRSWDLSDRVLSRFPAHEWDVIEQSVKRAADAVETFLADGVMAAMNRFNAPDEPPKPEND